MSRDAEGRSVVDVTLADSVAEFSKYSGWPELKESFMAGKVQAAYLLAPMVMDLVDSAHRDSEPLRGRSPVRAADAQGERHDGP